MHSKVGTRAPPTAPAAVSPEGQKSRRRRGRKGNRRRDGVRGRRRRRGNRRRDGVSEEKVKERNKGEKMRAKRQKVGAWVVMGWN